MPCCSHKRELSLTHIPHVLNTEELLSMKDHVPCYLLKQKTATKFSTSASRNCRRGCRSQSWNICSCEIVQENWEEGAFTEKNPTSLILTPNCQALLCLPFFHLHKLPTMKEQLQHSRPCVHPHLLVPRVFVSSRSPLQHHFFPMNRK